MSFSVDKAYVVHEQGFGDVLYFKRIASSSIDDFLRALDGEYAGPWEVCRQEGTARISLTGANAHRKVLATVDTEAEADACLHRFGCVADEKAAPEGNVRG